MFGRFLLIILFAGSALCFPQQKYLVYFKDKGIVSQNRFYKSAQLVSQCTQYLSSKSIERRKAVMGKDNYVNYDDVPVYTPYKTQIENSGIRIDKTLNWFNAVSCYLTQAQINGVKSFPFVEKIEPVKIFKAAAQKAFDVSFLYRAPQDVLNGTSFDYGYSLTQNALCGVPAVHDAGYDGSGIIIGVLDTGFEFSSPALGNIKMLAQHDFVFNDNITSNQSGDQADQQNHGTAVLSIIGGYAPGYLIGPAFNAGYLLAKTEDVRSETHIEEDNYAAALEWMEAQGVQITTSSLGYNIFDAGQTSYSYKDMDGKTTIITQAAEKAFERGVITLTAAGNEGANAWHYIIAPADGFNIIAVGAVTPDNVVAGFSSRGPTYDGRIKPEICAQGTSVFHANPLSSFYSSGSGTSFATPMAAGITALLLQANPYLNNQQVRNIILQAGDNFKTPDNDRGYGLLSAVRALSMPNLKKTPDGYELSKMFIGVKNITSGSVKLNYSVNSVPQAQLTMVYDGANRYTAELPHLNPLDKVSFTFTYNSPNGPSVDPVTDNYELTYGELFVYDKSFGARIELPENFQLYQNYPNPFVSGTKIKIDLPVDSDVNIEIYNILGQKVTTLYSGSMNAGSRIVTWDGRGAGGAKCASGVYILAVRSGGQTAIKKMVLIK